MLSDQKRCLNHLYSFPYFAALNITETQDMNIDLSFIKTQCAFCCAYRQLCAQSRALSRFWLS